jgi:hypothetical protein
LVTVLVCMCVLDARAERVAPRRPPPTPVPQSCVAQIEDEDADAIARAATARRRPRARVFLAPSLEAPSLDANMEAVERHRLSELALFENLGSIAERARPCYQRALDADPTLMGAVLLEVTTRERGVLEVESIPTTANDQVLTACAVEAFSGARTRRDHSVNVREAAVVFCPSDRSVCIAGPIARLAAPLDGRALQTAIAARSPAFAARARQAGRNVPRAGLIMYASVGRTSQISQLGTGTEVPPGLDTDMFFDIVGPMSGTCPPAGAWPRSLPFYVRLGVR